MTITLSVAGLDRRYLLYVPQTGSEPRPVILMLHGAGGSAGWARDESLWNRTADQQGFVMVYPEGLAVEPARPSGFLTNPQVWNAGAGPGLIVNRGPNDVEFLAAVIDDLPRRTPIDPRRIYVTGFSNGAAMTFRFAADRPDLVAAIAPVAGYCPEVEPLARPMPTLFLVGADDPLVPLDGGAVRSPWDGRIEVRPPLRESLARWARALGLDPSCRHTRDTAEMRVEEYSALFSAATIAGLGHHWPGGRGRLKRSLAGRPSNHVNANSMIWKFFQRIGERGTSGETSRGSVG